MLCLDEQQTRPSVHYARHRQAESPSPPSQTDIWKISKKKREEKSSSLGFEPTTTVKSQLHILINFDSNCEHTVSVSSLIKEGEVNAMHNFKSIKLDAK